MRILLLLLLLEGCWAINSIRQSMTQFPMTTSAMILGAPSWRMTLRDVFAAIPTVHLLFGLLPEPMVKIYLVLAKFTCNPTATASSFSRLKTDVPSAAAHHVFFIRIGQGLLGLFTMVPGFTRSVFLITLSSAILQKREDNPHYLLHQILGVALHSPSHSSSNQANWLCIFGFISSEYWTLSNRNTNALNGAEIQYEASPVSNSNVLTESGRNSNGLRISKACRLMLNVRQVSRNYDKNTFNPFCRRWKFAFGELKTLKVLVATNGFE